MKQDTGASGSGQEPTVLVYVDESEMPVCLEHEPCPDLGRIPSSTCRRIYLYGVGAAVFETSTDLDELAARLESLKVSISVRSGIATSRRMKKFVSDGWHATDDTPEFADPLVQELDVAGVFKGHACYFLTEEKQGNATDVYARLSLALARNLAARYRGQTVEFVFEAGGLPQRDAEEVIRAAGAPDDTNVRLETKGNVLLAVADYLLYAALKYAARTEQLCPGAECDIEHRVPVASDLIYGDDAAPLPFGHVGANERWHKLYYAFARSMSAAVRIAPPA